MHKYIQVNQVSETKTFATYIYVLPPEIKPGGKYLPPT